MIMLNDLDLVNRTLGNRLAAAVDALVERIVAQSC